MIQDVSPSQLSSMIGTIRPLLETTFEKAGGTAPDELIALCELGYRTLHLAGRDGFFIANWVGDEMHVVTGCAYQGVTRAGIDKIISAAANYAKQRGCSKMTFTSPRPGWARIADKVGAQIASINYEVVL